MTGIDGVGGPTPPRVTSRPTVRPGFSVPDQPAGAGQASSAAATHATSLSSMLSLQEFGSETVEDREARRRGHDMLAALAELQRALLSNGGDEQTLERLAELADAVPRATDPGLAATISAIVLRVRLELARRQT